MSSLTTALAIWGALLSTIVAIYNVYKDMRDSKYRGLLRIHVSLGYAYANNEEYLQRDIRILIINVGKANNIARYVGVEAPINEKEKGWVSFQTDLLPKKLEPGEEVEVRIVGPRVGYLNDDDVRIFVRDGFERAYFPTKENMKSVLSEYRGYREYRFPARRIMEG